MPGFLPEKADGMPVSIVFITLAFMQFLPFLQEMVCLLPSMQVFEAFLIASM